jgi:hypothetical protein
MKSYKSMVVKPLMLEANAWGLLTLSIPYEILDLDLELTPINPNIVFDSSDRIYRGVFRDSIVDLLLYNDSSINCVYEENSVFSSIKIMNERAEHNYITATTEDVRRVLEGLFNSFKRD